MIDTGKTIEETENITPAGFYGRNTRRRISGQNSSKTLLTYRLDTPTAERDNAYAAERSLSTLQQFVLKSLPAIPM